MGNGAKRFKYIKSTTHYSMKTEYIWFFILKMNKKYVSICIQIANRLNTSQFNRNL